LKIIFLFLKKIFHLSKNQSVLSHDDGFDDIFKKISFY